MVDIVYADVSMVPKGVAVGAAMEADIGGKWNSFEVTVKTGSPIEAGWYVGIRGTEYGGTVDWTEYPADGRTVVHGGRSWRGIIASKAILPGSGELNKTVSGEANSVLASLFSTLGLSSLFSVSSASTGVTVSWTFPRYVDDGAAAMIEEMLEAHGLRLSLSWNGSTVDTAAVPKATIELDSDLHPVKVYKQHRTVNHLVCAGSGEGLQREILHLYADSSGAVSTTQTLTGIDEVMAVYDLNNASGSELASEGAEKLAEYQGLDEAEITTLSGIGDIASEGDTFHAVNRLSGGEASAKVSRKTVKVDWRGNASVRYE